jgi:predicted acylesterase/phospholipase RssA
MGHIVWNGSGGATKGIGIFHATKVAIESGYKPTLYSGISVSALMCLPLALGKIEELELLFDTFTIDNIFDKNPLNKKGKPSFNSVLNIFKGKLGLATMNPLEKILRALVSEKEFIHFKYDHSSPECIIMTVDVKSGKRVFVDYKHCSYDEYIKFTLASASIPVFSEPVLLGDMVLFDGGLRDHSIGAWILENYEVDEMLTIWARPRNYKLANTSEWNPKNVFSILERSLDIQLIETSKNDEGNERRLATTNRVRYRTGFLPSILESIYDTDRGRLEKLKNAGIELGENIFKTK